MNRHLLIARLLTLLVVIAFGIAIWDISNAEANCRWEWDCTSGSCRQIQLCDNFIDLPAIKPPRIAPIAPIKPIEPIRVPSIPPIGASECINRYICDTGTGSCGWREVCF